jgi:hypothetical protein
MARNSNERWTPEEDKQLLKLRADGKSSILIAAAFRPTQLAEAKRWEHLAVSELEAHFSACGGAQGVEPKREAA